MRRGPALLLTYASAYASAYAGVTASRTTVLLAGRSGIAAMVDTVSPVQTLTFAWAAVNLALQPPYDTVQLQAIARTAAGAEINDPTLVVHYSTPNSAISVSATGLVTARQPTEVAYVIASVTQGGRTVSDTALIQVTPEPFPGPLTTLSFQPQPGALTVIYANMNEAAAGIGQQVLFFATIAKPHADTTLAPFRICAGEQGCQKYKLLVHFASSDPTIAYVPFSGSLDWLARIHTVRPGRVLLTVSTIAYGVRKRDSLPFSIGYPQKRVTELYIDNTHQPPQLALRPVQTLGWDPPPFSVGLGVFLQNATGEPVEVRLPTPAHGVHFNQGGAHRVRDTLPENQSEVWGDDAFTIVLDSVGTHVLQYRGVNTGVVRSDTVTVLPYP